MPPAARVGDMHTCPQQTPGTPPIPHVGGAILSGAPTVLIGGMPAARAGDVLTCVGPPDTIVRGAATVLIAGAPASRVGDASAHGGAVTVGCPTVLIGDAAGGGGTGGPGAIGAIDSAVARMEDQALGDGSAQSQTLKSARALAAPIAKLGCNAKEWKPRRER